MQKVWIIVICILISGSYFFGVYSVQNNTFPYSEIRSFYKQITFNENEIEFDVNIESLIHIKSMEDVQNTRIDLINYIWNNNGPPNHFPYSIEDNYNDNRYQNLENLKEIEKITIRMDYDLNSISYIFVANESNNKLIIYHEGHSGDFFNGIETIQFFLKNGYSVMAFSMPLHGMNNQPIVESEYFGPIHLTDHSYFRFLEDNNFTPIKFFVEPIFVSLNYIEQNYSFTSYHMVGLSGGGWTTVLYPAIDERISKSFSVAGSYPIFLRSEAGLRGDYEQRVPELYKIANYLDLYVMNSVGENRKFVQIFNKFDPCCFSGHGYQAYEKELKKRINSIQPSAYELYLDDSHFQHIISEKMLTTIVNEINYNK